MGFCFLKNAFLLANYWMIEVSRTSTPSLNSGEDCLEKCNIPCKMNSRFAFVIQFHNLVINSEKGTKTKMAFKRTQLQRNLFEKLFSMSPNRQQQNTKKPSIICDLQQLKWTQDLFISGLYVCHVFDVWACEEACACLDTFYRGPGRW